MTERPDSVTIEWGDKSLTLAANFAALLRLEEAADNCGVDWREFLADGVSIKKVSHLIELAAVLSGKKPRHIQQISPPLSLLQQGVSRAWTLANDGPEALARHIEEDDAAEGEAAADEGKPRSRLGRWFSKHIAWRFKPTSRKTPSGA